MQLGEYQRLSRQTAIYPGAGHNPVYPTLGLGGEAGELLEKALQDAPHKDFLGELGDVLWYESQLATELGLELESFEAHEDPRVKSAATRGVVASGSLDSLIECCARVVVAVAAVSECTKKMFRDDEGELTPERKEKYAALLKEVLVSWHLVAYCAGISPEGSAEANYAKLASRLERGVIKGSGDHR